jgi:hypothetical protein
MTIDNITTVLMYVNLFLIIILFIQYRNKINKLKKTILDKEFDLFVIQRKNQSLKNSVTVYTGWNTRYRKDIDILQKQLETVQKDYTKNTNLTKKTDDKQRETTRKDKRVDKRERRNDRKKK